MPRCSAEDCKKKLALTDMACKCSGVYCLAHRMPETHSCTFDFQAQQRENLMKYMSSPVIAKKVEII